MVVSIKRPACHQGFSLIEVTIALGVIAFALVAIMGLFPIAMKSATESRRETRATFIAQSVLADLGSGLSPTNTFVLTGPDVEQTVNRSTVNLTTNGTYHLVFSAEGEPLGTTTASAFSNSIASADSEFGAMLMISPDPVHTNLTRVEVLVEAPVAAPEANRSLYHFVTEMRNQ